jgi:hypothetical protein
LLAGEGHLLLSVGTKPRPGRRRKRREPETERQRERRETRRRRRRRRKSKRSYPHTSSHTPKCSATSQSYETLCQ